MGEQLVAIQAPGCSPNDFPSLHTCLALPPIVSKLAHNMADGCGVPISLQ